MNTMTARPQLLKQANLSLIRRVIKRKGTVTRAEIAWETKISSTTVRTLLTQMQCGGEIESIGYDESSGGRKAERYRFKMERYYGAALCIGETVIHVLVVNICGEIVEQGQVEIGNGDISAAITVCLDELFARKEIKSIGLGVPGVVDGSGYLRKNRENELDKIDIGDILTQRYQVPVVIENDLNAITIGFGLCYEKNFPKEEQEEQNMAFVYFEESCVSAGFLAGGKVIRGCSNYAGELGLLPESDEKSLAEVLSETKDDDKYTKLVIKIVSWICGILNPQYVALGGPYFRKDCLGPITDGLYARLPRNMFAEILYSPDAWHDYYEGMAYLTAGKMFDEIQFVKK